jgi:hypothetical protein
MLEAQGMPAAEIQQAIAASPMQTPVMNALAGLLNTFMTGVIVSAVVAVWIKAPGRIGR